MYPGIYSPLDLIAGPLWLGIILLVALAVRNQRYRNDPLRRYFLPALLLKLFGGTMVGVVFVFYYKSGDTILYFKAAQVLARAFYEDPVAWLKLLSYSNKQEVYADYDLFVRYGQYMVYLRDAKTYVVSKVVSVAAIAGFGSFVATGLVLSAMTFMGVWMLFKTIVRIFPEQHFAAAVGAFFLPSVFFWGSGILKDSISLALLGTLLYGLHAVFMRAHWVLLHVVLVVISVFLIFKIKEYIIYSFLPLALFWVGVSQLKRIGSPLARTAFGPAFVGLTLVVAFQLLTFLSSDSQRYSLNKVFDTASMVSGDLSSDYYYSESGGSRYSIGAFDPSPLGLISSFPVAVSYTFFRPFPWEVFKNPIMAFASLEALAVMFVFGRAVWRTGFRMFFKLLFASPFLLFAFTFSLLFAFMVGMTSGNYGNLVRYKIPCLPFFVSVVLITESLARQSQSSAPAAPPRPTLRSAQRTLAARGGAALKR